MILFQPSQMLSNTCLFARLPFATSESFVTEICRFIDSLPDDAKAGILRSYQDLFDRWESLSTPDSIKRNSAFR